MQIFMSYRRAESSDIAGRLHDTLSNYFGGNEVFRDVDNIRAAEDFVDRLHDVLRQCKAAIILIDTNWANERLHQPSDYVRIEVEAALERKIVVIPVLVSNSSMPRPELLPEALRPLCRINALPVRSGVEYKDNARRLIETLEQSVRTLKSVAAIQARRRYRIGAAVLVTMVLAGIVYAWLRPPVSTVPPPEATASLLPSVASSAGAPNSSTYVFDQEGASPAASASVHFITDRPGATVYVDTREACRPTPCTVQFEASRTVIEVQARLGSFSSPKKTLKSPFPSQVELKTIPVQNQNPAPAGTRWLDRFSNPE